MCTDGAAGRQLRFERRSRDPAAQDGISHRECPSTVVAKRDVHRGVRQRRDRKTVDPDATDGSSSASGLVSESSPLRGPSRRIENGDAVGHGQDPRQTVGDDRRCVGHDRARGRRLDCRRSCNVLLPDGGLVPLLADDEGAVSHSDQRPAPERSLLGSRGRRIGVGGDDVRHRHDPSMRHDRAPQSTRAHPVEKCVDATATVHLAVGTTNPTSNWGIGLVRCRIRGSEQRARRRRAPRYDTSGRTAAARASTSDWASAGVDATVSM